MIGQKVVYIKYHERNGAWYFDWTYVTTTAELSTKLNRFCYETLGGHSLRLPVSLKGYKWPQQLQMQRMKALAARIHPGSFDSDGNGTVEFD